MHSPGGHIVLTCGLYVTSQHCDKAILLTQIPQGTMQSTVANLQDKKFRTGVLQCQPRPIMSPNQQSGSTEGNKALTKISEIIT